MTVAGELKALANPRRAFELQRFFKTAKGQYGEGDIFLGLTVPEVRKIAAKHKKLPFTEIEKLTTSKFHEFRLCGLVILTLQYKASKERNQQKKIFNFYLRQAKNGNVNNWDLVDVTAPTLGEYLLQLEDPMAVLNKLAKSKSLWERRVSMILTFALIRAGDLEPTIIIAQALLKDEQDLIHKAVGWMLREAGKRDVMLLRKFLREHAHEMPRTMLRYAIEKLPERERKQWLLESKS